MNKRQILAANKDQPLFFQHSHLMGIEAIWVRCTWLLEIQECPNCGKRDYCNSPGRTGPQQAQQRKPESLPFIKTESHTSVYGLERRDLSSCI